LEFEKYVIGDHNSRVTTMAAINHTQPSPDPAVPLPHKVARLNGSYQVNEGPGKSLHVMPGDRVRVEVFVKYLNLRQDEGIGAAALLSFLLGGATGFTQVSIDGSTFKITQSSTGLSAILGGTGEGGTAPQAYLNAYWLNESDDLASAQHKNAPVTTAAAITPTTVTAAHERLFFEWVIDKPGDLYINVSHDAPENIDVYFDDLHIEHLYSPIVAGSDFYPFGLEMADRHLTREKYRYGYQGKYAEKDDETGWSHFELREYDALIGRMTTTDPEGEFYSSYLGMGNDPVNNTDPTGGAICPTCPGGAEYDAYRNSSSNFTFDSESGIVANGIGLDNIVVRPDLVYNFGGSVYTGVPYPDRDYAAIQNQAAYESAAVLAVSYGLFKSQFVSENHSDDPSVQAHSVPIPGNVNITKILQGLKIARQAKDISSAIGKNSVFIRTTKGAIRFDLVGRVHGKVPTPHLQKYKNNYVDGVLRSVSRDGTEAIPMTQDHIRLVRNYLNSLK
jgi:RHS repeat-associated protein